MSALPLRLVPAPVLLLPLTGCALLGVPVLFIDSAIPDREAVMKRLRALLAQRFDERMRSPGSP